MAVSRCLFKKKNGLMLLLNDNRLFSRVTVIIWIRNIIGYHKPCEGSIYSPYERYQELHI